MNRRFNLERSSNQQGAEEQSKPLIPLSWLSEQKALANDDIGGEPAGSTQRVLKQ